MRFIPRLYYGFVYLFCFTVFFFQCVCLMFVCLFEGNGNEIYFQTFLLLVYIKAAGVCGSILYPATLLKECIRSKHFLVESSRSSISRHLKMDSLSSSYAIASVLFPSCHMALSRTSRTALKKGGESGHLSCS